MQVPVPEQVQVPVQVQVPEPVQVQVPEPVQVQVQVQVSAGFYCRQQQLRWFFHRDCRYGMQSPSRQQLPQLPSPVPL